MRCEKEFELSPLLTRVKLVKAVHYLRLPVCQRMCPSISNVFIKCLKFLDRPLNPKLFLILIIIFSVAVVTLDFQIELRPGILIQGILICWCFFGVG